MYILNLPGRKEETGRKRRVHIKNFSALRALHGIDKNVGWADFVPMLRFKQ
jgi:hypothetical protein